MSTDQQTESKPKTITILVNNNPVDLPDKHTTGAEIKRVAGLPAHFKLYGPHGEEIADATKLSVHKGEKFTAISGVDVS